MNIFLYDMIDLNLSLSNTICLRLDVPDWKIAMGRVWHQNIYNYHKISYIGRTKSQNLNDSRLILQLTLSSPLKSGG